MNILKDSTVITKSSRKEFTMGYNSITVLTSFLILVAYSVLLHSANANAIESSADTQTTNEFSHKRPTVWLNSIPVLRRLKPLNSYPLYRRDLQSEVEFTDSDSINNIEKKFDDYGHMRFGKRGGGEGDGFDDYGHMR